MSGLKKFLQLSDNFTNLAPNAKIWSHIKDMDETTLMVYREIIRMNTNKTIQVLKLYTQ